MLHYGSNTAIRDGALNQQMSKVLLQLAIVAGYENNMTR